MNTETKWTPGPWDKSHNGHYWDIGVRDDCPVVPIYPSTCIGVQTGMEANANLIVAAPELYDALENLVRELEETGLQAEWDNYPQARAALAKARGEQA